MGRNPNTRSMLDHPDEEERRDLADAVKGLPKETKLSRLERLRLIVAEHQARRIEGYLVDGFTASMLVQIYDKLNEQNRAKFIALPLRKMVAVGWKLAKG